MSGSERSALRRLYKQIPTFECRDGCTDCCGPVPVSPLEAKRLDLEGQTLIPTKQNCLTCPFVDQGRCSVYADRPFMCRLFGTVDTSLLRCPHGCRPEKMLTPLQAQLLKEEYLSLFPD